MRKLIVLNGYSGGCNAAIVDMSQTNPGAGAVADGTSPAPATQHDIICRGHLLKYYVPLVSGSHVTTTTTS
jgi:hypothetical protein